MRLLLVAEEAAGVRVLRALLQGEHDLVAVMARDAGRAAGVSTWELARTSGLETWPSDLVRDPAFADRIRANGVELVLNVHSLYVVHPAVLKAPTLGWYNLHPGPLPAFAGLNAVSWSIYLGEDRHAVTLHRMTAQLDRGDIAYEEVFPIGEHDTALTLSAQCARHGVDLIMRLVEQAASDPTRIPAITQDMGSFRYFDARPPRDVIVRWDAPAAEVSRFIRAFDYHPLHSPWGHPQATIAGRRVGVSGVSRTGRPADGPPGGVEPAEGGSLHVSCADEWVTIRRAHVNGKTIDAATLTAPPVPSGGPDQ